jgi:hypothetical protein
MQMHALLIRATAAISVLAVVSACSPDTLRPHDQTIVYREVPEFLEAWQAAGNEGRFGDLKPLYAPLTGFVWVEQGKVAYADAGQIAAGLDSAAASGAKVTLQLSDTVVTALAPRAAAVSASYTMSFAFAPGQTYDTAGVFTGVVVKRDERWMFLQGHFSAPMPEAIAATPPEEPIPSGPPPG